MNRPGLNSESGSYRCLMDRIMLISGPGFPHASASSLMKLGARSIMRVPPIDSTDELKIVAFNSDPYQPDPHVGGSKAFLKMFLAYFQRLRSLGNRDAAF